MAATIFVPRRTLVDAAIRGQSLAYQILVILGGSLLVALLAQIAIPLPWTPVPITGQTYGVLLVGALLGSRRGSLSMLLYMLEGGVGLPFFAGAASGWSSIVGATGGYLVGFVVAAAVVGWLAERGWDRHFVWAAAMMLVGSVTIYAIGVMWLATFVGVERAIPLGLLPFIPGDMLKLVLAAMTLPAAWKLAGRLSR